MLLIGFTGYQALQARESLEIVAADFEELTGQLKSGDGDAARSTLGSAQAAAADAKGKTRGPGWWLTSRLPGVGDDVAAVRTVAQVTDVLASKVLPDVVAASEALDPVNLRPANGRIALAPIADVAPAVIAADRELQRQEALVAALDTDEINSQLAAPVRLMQGKLREAAALSDKAADAVRLLPPMLGAEGKRRYLLLFQNNAEIRASGGIPGAYAVLTAERGKVTLGEQGSAADIGQLDSPVLPVTAAEEALYEDKLARFPQNINLTPDFPRTAELAQAMWRARTGVEVDGVVSVDPVALSYLLRGTGPVQVPGGRLSVDNAVDLLLSRTYLEQPDPERQDAFFAAAARKVFDAVSAGVGDPQQVLDAVAMAATERRILLWSAQEQEQAVLDGTTLGGRVPGDADSASPYVGVYLNDGTGGKLQYYLEHRVDVDSVSCNPAGRQQLAVTLTLHSAAPEDAARLPRSVIGPGFGAEPGYMRMTVQLYAPAGGWIEAFSLDGLEQGLGGLEHLGHAVAQSTVDLAPGERRELSFTVMGGLHQTGLVDLRVTPGGRTTGVGTVGASACT